MGFASMGVFKAFVAISAVIAIASMLQGCGCDEGKGKACTLDTSQSACTGFDAYTKCIKDDAGCCDYEANGVTMGQAIDTAKNQEVLGQKPFGACTNACTA